MSTANRLQTAFLIAALSTPCLAHHGVAPHYDVTKPVELQGTITRFDFINPHSFVYIATVNAAGAEETWSCELASRSVLERNGLSIDTFRVGEPIVVEGVVARVKPTGCALRVARFPDGSRLVANELFGPTSTAPPAVTEDPGAIFGVWTMKRFSVSRYDGQLTPVGETARAAFDPIEDDPAIYCDPTSPVRFWINVNEPFEIRREADRVVIDNRFMDSRRIVYLGDASAPANFERDTMGYSRGHFEGKALVATTDQFRAGVLEPRFGVLHSANLELMERLEVNESGELEISWIIDDPEYFIEPVTQTEVYVRSARNDEPYDCRPGYQQ